MRDKRGRRVCTCGGYWFPHRLGGGACHNGPRAEYYAALRQGATPAEALELLWSDKLEAMMKPINGIEAEELNEQDSDFAMLEYFGQALIPEPRNPNVKPMPSEVPAWDIVDTEADRIRRRLSK